MLGIILAPYGQIPGAYPSAINYSYGGGGSYLCPDDPQFNTRGEPGLYYDTQLGGSSLRSKLAVWRAKRQIKKQLGLRGIPTDAELATVYGYTPVASGWVAAKEGYFPSPWLPPNGWNPAAQFGPMRSLNGLRGVGDPPTVPTVGVNPADDVIATMNAHNQRIFALTLISTCAAGLAALLTTYRTMRLLKKER